METLPALRHIDAFPVEIDGEQQFCLSDPTGLAQEQLVLSPAAFFVAAMLDGERSLSDIQAAFARQTEGVILPAERVEEIVGFLDEQLFLESPRFRERLDTLTAGFRAARVREAWCAGKSYAADPAELASFLDGFFTHADGPGTKPAPGTGEPLRGLIVPHIDFHRGGPAYAHGYARLLASGKPRTVFIFGVAHAGAAVPFVLTRKAFATPFGVLEVDQAAMDVLEAACDWDPYTDELVHRTEHSVEFQAVMLAHLYGPSVKIVPILAASLTERWGERPEDNPAVQRFLKVCQAYASNPANGVTVIAGADLAHVGRCFGDDFEIDEELLESISMRDMEDLQPVCHVNGTDWYEAVMRDDNERRVCGLGCIYGALKTMDTQISGTMLHYGCAPDPQGGIVSFASVAFQ